MTTIPLKPIRDNILIKPLELEAKTKSGILLKNPPAEKGARRGTVIAVGPGVKVEGEWIPMEIEIGERVVIRKYGPTDVEFQGQKYILARQYDVIGKIND